MIYQYENNQEHLSALSLNEKKLTEINENLKLFDKRFSELEKRYIYLKQSLMKPGGYHGILKIPFLKCKQIRPNHLNAYFGIIQLGSP